MENGARGLSSPFSGASASGACAAENATDNDNDDDAFEVHLNKLSNSPSFDMTETTPFFARSRSQSSSDQKHETKGFFYTPELSQRQLLVNFILVFVGFGAILVFNKKRKKQTILYTPLPTIIDR